MTNKEKYQAFLKVEQEIPVFSQSWFLDAVCGEENWDVALVEKGNKVVASMPYYRKKKLVFNLITMPQHGQTMGVYIAYPKGQKYETKLSYERKMMDALINQLPKVDYFNQTMHYSVTNWLPFYWRGYKQTTNYTYVIEDLSDIEQVFKNFSNGKRKDIQKAETIVEIKRDISAEDFYANHKMTLEKQGAQISYTFEHFKGIYDGAYQHNSGGTFYAIDTEKNIHAAFLIIWDKQSAYNLITTIDPSFRSSGAAALLFKEVIRFSSTITNTFDFEGSMIESVEKSYRQFGAKQKAYFDITKVDSKILKLLLD